MNRFDDTRSVECSVCLTYWRSSQSVTSADVSWLLFLFLVARLHMHVITTVVFDKQPTLIMGAKSCFS